MKGIRLFAVTALLSVLTCSAGYAENYESVLYFKVYGTPGHPISSNNWNAMYSTGKSFIMAARTIDYAANTMEVLFFVSDLVPASTGNRWMKFEVDYSNGDPADIINLDIPPNAATDMSFDGNYCTGTMTYSPMLTMSVFSQDCNVIDLGLIPSAGKSVIQVSASQGGPYTTLKSIPSTYGSASITAAELRDLNMNPYGVTWVKYYDDYAVSPSYSSYKDRRVSQPISIHLLGERPTVGVGTPVNAACYGEASGSVTLNISSLAATHFLVSVYSSPTSQVPVDQVPTDLGAISLSNLKAGTWTLKIENDDGDAIAHCSTTKTVTIGQPTAPLAIVIDSSKHNGYSISCYGGADGTATAIASGGNGNYKDYSWSTGATTASVSGLSKGSYTVSLKDEKNCSVNKTFTMSAPVAVTATPSVPKPHSGYAVSCFDKADGGASVTGGGGVGGYSYVWFNGSTNATVSGLGTGTYTVKVKDANGCFSPDAQATLTAPAPIDFTIDLVSGLTCSGDATAILEAKPVAATIIGAPYYSWTSGETEATVRDKAAGTYTVTVSDDQGCSVTKSRTVNNPPGYTVALSAASNYNNALIKCHGDANGKLVATVKNAAGVVAAPQDYSWFRNGVTAGSGTTLSLLDGLDQATYSVEITYDGGCKAAAQFVLDDPDELTVTLAATTLATFHNQPISCHDATDANLKATINNGGTAPYTYLWGNTANTTTLLSSVGAGEYTFTVTDINNCTATNTITLVNPAPVVASIFDVSDYSGYGVSCAGLTDGSMTASGSGGTGVYTYSWSNGGRTTAVNGLLGKGTYTVTVSDNNNCSAQASETISEPPVLEASIGSYTDVKCNGGSDGSISLSANGGVGNYEYSINNGTTWLGGAEFKGLPIGMYTLLVRDRNNCRASAARTLAQPTALALSFIDKEPAFCADPRGGVTAYVSGGSPGYTYSWTDGLGNVVGTVMRLQNVRGGIYTVTVHDAHNCPIGDDTGITSTDGAKVDYAAVAALCHDSADGSATLTITAGDGPFIIEWPDGQSTLEGIKLKGGEYAVSITDGHDCTVVEEVTIPAPETLSLEVASFTEPTCNGDCDGVLTLLAHGGTGTYVYTWNGQTGVTQTGLCKGTYNVVLTDANNCKLEQPVTLKEPEVLTVKMESSTLATCMDGCDGKLTVAGAGGNGGYIYSWDGGITGSEREQLCPGQYSVMVTDGKGCIGSTIVTLANTPPVPINLGGGVTLCVGQTYALDAGTGWKTIQWSGSGLSSNAQVVNVKDPGSYWIEVLDGKGCVGRDTFLLETSYDLLKASFMIPAQAAAGDTIAIIDVSWPLPESVEWNLPLEMKRVSGSEDVVFGQFNATGTYAIGLTAHLGECVDYVEKNIVIQQGTADDTDGRLGYEEYIKAFGLYANPNDGSFDVIVDLAHTDDIMLSIWNSQTGSLVGKVSEKGSASYSVHVDLRPLSAGAYILRLDHARGSSYLRFIVR